MDEVTTDAAGEKGGSLTIAVPKGRLFDPAVAYLRKRGYLPAGFCSSGRRLVAEDRSQGVRGLQVRAGDVVAYASQGAADVGIVGKDVLLEAPGQVWELRDLGFGACDMVVAGPRRESLGSASLQEPWQWLQGLPRRLRVATKFPVTARRCFRDLGIDADVTHLRGSVELAPLVGMADVIVDLVETGRTLRDNDLCVYRKIAEVSARLVANPVSWRTKRSRILGLAGWTDTMGSSA